MAALEVRLAAVLVDRPGLPPLALCEVGPADSPHPFTLDPALEDEGEDG